MNIKSRNEYSTKSFKEESMILLEYSGKKWNMDFLVNFVTADISRSTVLTGN